MAEAIGIATSIMGLIDATTKIIHYVNTVRDAQKEAIQFASEASGNMCLLFRLKQRLDDPKTAKGWRLTISQSVGDLLIQVGAALKELIAELHLDSTGLGKLGRKFLWPITKGDLKDILDRIHRLNTLVGLALDDNLIELTSATKSDTTAIMKDTALIKDIKYEMGEIASHTEAAVDSARQQAQELRHQKIVSFIAPHDFGSKLSEILCNRQSGTGDWFVQAQEFRKWLETDGSILWCPGIPGAGKTTLIATTIDYLQSHFRSKNDSRVIYAFCDYKDRGIQTVKTVLASLWGHLMKSRLLDTKECESLETGYLHRSVQPTETDMLSILQTEISRYPRVFIVLDALDEFDANHREDLLVALQTSGLNINLLITSRYIVQVDPHAVRHTQQLQISAADADIRTYIAGHLTAETRLGRHVEKDPKLADDITNTLIQRAQGIFLLAKLHLETLHTKLNSRAVRRALNTLPKGKDAMKETYDQALSRIESQNSDDRGLAERVIMWLCHSLHPFTLADLQYAVSFDLEDDEFGEDDLIPLDLIISVCGGLVVPESSGRGLCFVHYTTQEYFSHIRTTLFPYGHAVIALTCIKFLCLERSIIDRQYIYQPEWPREYNGLLEYAALHWGHHVRHFYIEEDRNSLRQSKDDVSYLTTRRELEDAIQVFTTLHNNFSSAFRVLERSVLGIRVNGHVQLLLGSCFHVVKNEYNILKSGSSYILQAFAYFGLQKLIKDIASVDANCLHNTLGGFGNILHWAVLGGHQSILSLLLKDYSLFKLVDEKGFDKLEPLHVACLLDRTKAVKALLEFGANPMHIRGLFRSTVLHIAARLGNGEILSEILATENGKEALLCKDSFGCIPLQVSAQCGSIEGTRLLLAAIGNLTDVNIISFKSVFSDNILHAAAARDDPAFSLAFLEAPFGPQLASGKNKDNEVPFQTAIQCHCVEVVKLFMDWTSQDLFRDCPDVLQSALHYAIETSSTEATEHPVINLLIDYIPRVKVANQSSMTALHFATKRGRTSVIDLVLRRLSSYNLLEKKDSRGCTAVHYAITQPGIGTLPFLIERGANIHATDYSGQSPVHKIPAAHRMLCPILLDILVENGADIDAQDSFGRTALHIAVSDDKFDAAAVLVNKGAAINVVDQNGETPISIALVKGNDHITDLLKGVGAKAVKYMPTETHTEKRENGIGS